MKYLIMLMGLFQIATAFAEEARIWADMEVNYKTVHLILDTGCPVTMLWPKTAERLNLHLTNFTDITPAVSSQLPIMATETCRVNFRGNAKDTQIGVCKSQPPGTPDFEGMMGWGSVKRMVFRIEAGWEKFTLMNGVPADTLSWQSFDLDTNSIIMQLQTTGSDGKKFIITIDTGSSDGVVLNPKRWHDWRANNKEAPVTLKSGWLFSGYYISETAWCNNIALGDLRLADVPISDGTPYEMSAGGNGQADALIGVRALRGLDFIVDGPHNSVRIKPTREVLPPYEDEFNRLGATFFPETTDGEDLVAKVLEGTPAYEAGVRDGDILQQIDDLNVTHWRNDADFHPANYWGRVPGTKYVLTLRRGKKIITTTVTLREIVKTVKN